MERLATLTAQDLGEDLRVVAFRGTERLCRTYQFDVHFQVAGGDALDLEAGVGTRATLEISQGQDGTPFRFHGVLASVQMLIQTAEWALYRANLVPALWHLAQDHHSNAFTKITVPDLIEKVLQDSGVLTSADYELQLQGEYAEEELIVQYRESNLAFLQRWMEHEGIYYYFDQSGAQEKLIIADHPSAHGKLVDKTIPYFPIDGDDGSLGDSFDTFASMHHATVKQVRLADYDYGRPALDVSSNSNVSARGVGEISLHGGRFFDPSTAERYARLRAEELRAREVVYYAAGAALHVTAGFRVEVDQHPTEALNKTYLATEVHHFCNQLGGSHTAAVQRWLKLTHEDPYRVEAHFIDASLPYRAPLETAKPRIWGYENGVVDGEADSPYAQIDGDGRYKVKFHFDESDLSEGKASTFVRMSQPHGGGTEGFHFPLRKGTEVIFSFLGGDPDRPVITGVVPNATTPSPVTEGNHTKNIIRTGSGSHITIDDAAGKEYIHFQTPKLTEWFLGGPTDRHPDEHTNREITDVPTARGPASGGSTAHPLSVYLYTDQNAGFVIDGSKYEDTAGKIQIFGGGVLDEYYVGPHHYNMVGPSTQFFLNNRETTVAGHEFLTVEEDMQVTITDGLTVTVTGGNTMIDSSGTTEIKSGGEVHVHSTDANLKLYSDAAMIDAYAETGIDMKSPAKITIESEGDKVDIKSASTFSKWALGDHIEGEFANKVKFTYGGGIDVKVGLYVDAFLGGKVELSAAYKLGIATAMAIEANFGSKLEVKGALVLEMETARIKTVGSVEVDMLPARLQQAQAWIAQRSIMVVS